MKIEIPHTEEIEKFYEDIEKERRLNERKKIRKGSRR